MIKKGGFNDISLYDHEHNFICKYDSEQHGLISNLLIQERNKNINYPQLQEIIYMCEGLKNQLERNRQSFPLSMYELLQQELQSIFIEIQNILNKGENEL